MNIIVRSYDGKMVNIPEEKKEDYLKTQKEIQMYIEQGKTIDEIKELLKENV